MSISSTLKPSRRGDRHAARLASTRGRCRLAMGLERVIDAADEPAGRLTSAVPVQRSEILAARPLLREVAAEVRDADRVGPRGLEMVDRLLTDGNSPLYAPAAPGTLDASLRHIRSALLLR